MSRLCGWSLLCCVNLCFPFNLNNFILSEFHRSPFWWIQIFFPICLSFFKLLIQEVGHMQFLLHEAASTKKLPDTSLSREHWSYWDLELSSRKKLSASWEKMSRNYQNKFIRFSSLCHIMWWSQYLHKFDWNDYNGLVWAQEAYPVANKGEYIREGYALRKSLKGLKYKKQKKEY